MEATLKIEYNSLLIVISESIYDHCNRNPANYRIYLLQFILKRKRAVGTREIVNGAHSKSRDMTQDKTAIAKYTSAK